jgi:hypothetical protein
MYSTGARNIVAAGEGAAAEDAAQMFATSMNKDTQSTATRGNLAIKLIL